MPRNLPYFWPRSRPRLEAAYGAAVRLLVLCCLMAISSIFPVILQASAQDVVGEVEEIEEVQKKKNTPVTKGRFGYHFSGSTFLNTIQAINRAIGPYRPIRLPEDDVMPYPFSFFSIRYDAYEISIADGGDGGNESLLRFTARYNHYTNKNAYGFAGLIIWRFHKKYNFQDPDGVPIITGRPGGKNIIPGITIGTGIEYKLFIFTFTHEVEVYASACKYDNFICYGADFRFLGFHIPF